MPGLIEHSRAYRPFQYPWAMEATEEHEKIHWGTWEAELQEDVKQWKGGDLNEIEKTHITQILRLFTQSDVQVGANYCDLFIPKFKNNEIRNMLLSFANREGVHQRAYALLNDTLGLHEREYWAFLEYEELAAKIEFMQDNNVSTLAGLGQALAQSVCNEGMSLFSAFVMLLNYQRFGKMKGMCTVVEWSVRDETMHVQYMSRLFRTFCEEHPRIVNDEFKSNIYKMYDRAVALEDKVIELSYKIGEPEGLNAEEVMAYIRYMADRRLIQLGLKGIFNVKENPLPWLDWVLNGDTMSNFFEKRVTDYSASGFKGNWGWDGDSASL
jgi:ribonucleotide reductase beta subunit family protein with ferritin-like domain